MFPKKFRWVTKFLYLLVHHMFHPAPYNKSELKCRKFGAFQLLWKREMRLIERSFTLRLNCLLVSRQIFKRKTVLEVFSTIEQMLAVGEIFNFQDQRTGKWLNSSLSVKGRYHGSCNSLETVFDDENSWRECCHLLSSVAYFFYQFLNIQLETLGNPSSFTVRGLWRWRYAKTWRVFETRFKISRHCFFQHGVDQCHHLVAFLFQNGDYLKVLLLSEF